MPTDSTPFVTAQINNFSANLAGLYSNIAKPVLDLMLFSVQLSKNVGAEGLIGLAVLIQGSSALRKSLFHLLWPGVRLTHLFLFAVKAITPAFGQFAAQTAQLEGQLSSSDARPFHGPETD